MSEGDGYNALIQSALERAQLTGTAMHVYCTAAQWVVSPQPPPFHRQHIRCEPDPPLVLGCARTEQGHWSEAVLWPRELVAVKREEQG